MRKKEFWIRLAILLVGLTIAHFGVTLFLQSALGADPFNVLVQGLFNQLFKLTGWSVLTHGRVHIAVCLIIIIVLLFVDRSYIKTGTVLCMVCGGPIIDLFTLLVAPVFNEASPVWLRYVGLVIGCVILAFGMTIVIRSEAGTGPNDLVAVVISDKWKKKFGIIRVAVDLLFVLAGWLMGGTVGAGTVICAFLVGPVANLFLPVSGKIVNRIVSGKRQAKEC